MATAFSPARPMDRVRASAPNSLFMYASVSAVLFPITGLRVVEAHLAVLHEDERSSRGAAPSRTTPSMPQNLISAPRNPPA